MHIDKIKYPPVLGHCWWLCFYIFPCFEFLRSPNLTSFMSAFLVRKNHNCPWLLPCIDIRGGLDAERWHDVQDKRKGKTILELSGSAYLWKAWLSSDLRKSRPLLGEERERIPGLVGWRGQQQDWRKVKASAWALLPLRAGRDGCGAPAGISLPTLLWSLHSLQQDTSTGTGISTTAPGWLGADQLKCSEPPQKLIWKEERTCKKPRHLTACIKDHGEQGPTLYGASVTPVPPLPNAALSSLT